MLGIRWGVGVGGGGGGFRSYPSSYDCCRWRAAASMAWAYLALLSMMPSILWPIWISVISWPVACLASAMYNVLFFRGPVLWPISS